MSEVWGGGSPPCPRPPSVKYAYARASHPSWAAASWLGGRPQQAPSEAQHEVQSLGERGGVEAPEGVLVGDVAKFRDDSEASFLDLFQPHGVAVCQRRVPDWSGIIEASPDIPLV